MDPAKTTRKTSDDTAIMCLSFDFLEHKIYIRDICAGKMHPYDSYAKCLEFARKYKSKLLAIETAGLNEYITYPMKNFLEKNNASDIAMMELKPGGVQKEDRIRGISWFYQSGYVYHKKGVCEKLEGQLLSFPNAANDDVSDCLAYGVAMLKKGGIYFPHWVRNIGREALLREKLELEGMDAEDMEPLLEMAAYGDEPIDPSSWEII
jgi:phage terminase large subunit-like protein